jgi:hypothetical protein
MIASLKGQVLRAEQANGPDRWSVFFFVIDEQSDSVTLVELPKSIVSGDNHCGMETPVMPANDVELRGDADARAVHARKSMTDTGESLISCDDRALVMFGGRRSWNEQGEVQREECPLSLWDGQPAPFEYH